MPERTDAQRREFVRRHRDACAELIRARRQTVGAKIEALDDESAENRRQIERLRAEDEAILDEIARLLTLADPPEVTARVERARARLAEVEAEGVEAGLIAPPAR